MKKTQKYFIPLIIIFLLLSTTSCNPNKNQIELSGTTQGTFYNIKYYSKDKINYQNSVDSILSVIDNSLSIYNKNSTISKINRREKNIKPDNHIIYNFNISKEIYDETNGAFDVTAKRLFDAWGFGNHNLHNPLSEEEVEKILPYIGNNKVKLDNNNNFIFENDSIELCFNAVAKGYTVKVIADFFDSQNLESYIIEIGGEVYAKGTKPFNKSWKVGIANPEKNSTSLYTFFKLNNKSAVTSGNYNNFYEYNGKKYTHVIDPRNGYPTENGVLSVTVFHENPAIADAWATAIMVLGLDQTKEIVEKIEGIGVYIIYSNQDSYNDIYQTSNENDSTSEQKDDDFLVWTNMEI
ncbi:MAG: FAD:protein FMN transferase [Bacteroidales bacterium]|jgi:thiamine biosynthesis lipoprotein